MSHKYKQEELYPWTQYINNNLKRCRSLRRYLPIDPEGDQLLRTISNSDGVLLKELLLYCAGERRGEIAKHFIKFQQPRASKPLSVFESNLNYDQCIKAAQALGVQVINIGPADLKTPSYLILGLLWQIIKIGLRNKLGQGGTPRAPGVTADGELEQLVLQWACEQTGMQLQDTGSAFADGVALFALSHKLAEAQLVETDVDIAQAGRLTPVERIEAALQLTEQLGIERFLRVQDVQAANSQLILTLLVEIFSRQIQREIGMGGDMASEFRPLNVHRIIVDTQDIRLLRYLDYRGHAKFDCYKAQGCLDAIEVVVCVNEHLKNVVKEMHLQLTPQQLDDNTYQILVNNLPASEVDNQIHKCVQSLRDALDELISQKMTPQVQNHLFIIFKTLMLLSTDPLQRIELRKTDFMYTIEKLLPLNIVAHTFLPMLFYLHEMRLVTGQVQYDELAEQFVTDTQKQLDQLTSVDQKAALLYIVGQISQKQDVQAFVAKSSVSMVMGLLKGQHRDHATAMAALAMLYETLSHAPESVVDYQAVESAIDQSIRFGQSVRDPFYQSLQMQLTAEFIQATMQRYPERLLQYLVGSKHIQASIAGVLDFEEISEFQDQRRIVSDSVVLKAVRMGLKSDGVSETVRRSAAKILTVSQEPSKLIEQSYRSIIDENLGNQFLRRAARNATYALLDISQAVVDEFVATFKQVVKSSSVTAFLESLNDIAMCKEVLQANEEQLVSVLDTTLACMFKHQNDILVVSRVLDFLGIYADQPVFHTCGAFEQADAMAEDLLTDRDVAAAYLDMLGQVLRAGPGEECLDVCLNSLQRIAKLHEQDAVLVGAYYDTVARFAGPGLGAAFCAATHFFDRAADDLASFAGNALVVRSVMAALERLAGGSAACCRTAFEAGTLRQMRQYGRFWRADPSIADLVLGAHVWAMYYLGDEFEVVEVADDLEALM